MKNLIALLVVSFATSIYAGMVPPPEKQCYDTCMYHKDDYYCCVCECYGGWDFCEACRDQKKLPAPFDSGTAKKIPDSEH